MLACVAGVGAISPGASDKRIRGVVMRLIIAPLKTSRNRLAAGLRVPTDKKSR